MTYINTVTTSIWSATMRSNMEGTQQLVSQRPLSPMGAERLINQTRREEGREPVVVVRVESMRLER